nr:helix-turn-helix transcriptional regulator [Demequina litorisediminis]
MVDSRNAAERIRTLRELNGWTQAELAGASGVSQPLLSSIENLRRDASDETLRAIANAADTPFSFFEVTGSDAPSDSLHFRRNKSASVKIGRQVKAYFSEGRRVAGAALDRIEYPIGSLPFADARLSTMTAVAIEDYAAKTRLALGIEADAPIGNLTRAIERTGVPVFRLTLPGIEEGHVVGKGHYGVSASAAPASRTAIAYSSASGDRDRFTLAHEPGPRCFALIPRPGRRRGERSQPVCRSLAPAGEPRRHARRRTHHPRQLRSR